MTVLLLAACGETTHSTPAPEAIATAESASTEITIAAPFSTTPVADDDDRGEPIVLHGRVFGSGPTGVILAHMRPADQTSWFPFATLLAATGRFTVLTFDFRGFGDSTGEKEFDRLDTDLAAAYRYMAEQIGATKIFLVGASMGGTASLAVGGRLGAAGIVSISSPAQFQSLDALGAVGAIAAPKLFVASEDDVPAARSEEQFWAGALDPKEQEIYEGDAHGTNLFEGPHRAELEQRLIDFLSTP